MNSWFPVAEYSVSLKRTLVFARMYPSKLIHLQFESLDPSEQFIPNWKGVHANLSYKFEYTVDKIVIWYNVRSKAKIRNQVQPSYMDIPIDWNAIYTGLKIIEK